GLVTADDSQPGNGPKLLKRERGPECTPVFREASATKRIEVHQTCRGEPAALEVDVETAGQRFADCAAVPSEFGGDHDVAQEPLEEHTFQDAFVALEALGIAARELFLLQSCPEDVGALDDAFGQRRGDARWRRPGLPVAASGVRVLLHGLPDQWKEPPGHAARIAGVVLQDPLFAQSSEELER